MSLQLEANNVAFTILFVKGKLTTFEDFKKRCKFKLTDQWTEESFNKLLKEWEGSDKKELQKWLDNRLKNEKESDYVKISKEEALEIIYTALVSYVEDCAGQDSEEAKEIDEAYEVIKNLK